MGHQKQNSQPLIFKPIQDFPFVKAGDDISEMAITSLKDNRIQLADKDILVFAQKVISKSENRMVNLSSVHCSETAIQIAEETGKNPRLVELILSESKGIIRKRPGLIIAEHRNGFICANAGIDHSNVDKPEGSDDDWVLLLPLDADKSASKIQSDILKRTGKSIGVLIIDSHGRAWRSGTVGITIGTASVPELVSKIGERDLFGTSLDVSTRTTPEIVSASDVSIDLMMACGLSANLTFKYNSFSRSKSAGYFALPVTLSFASIRSID